MVAGGHVGESRSSNESTPYVESAYGAELIDQRLTAWIISV